MLIAVFHSLLLKLKWEMLKLLAEDRADGRESDDRRKVPLAPFGLLPGNY
jgi:hypothetical protein